MSALPFFTSPLHPDPRFPNSNLTHKAYVFRRQHATLLYTRVRFIGPRSWHGFDTIQYPIFGSPEVGELERLRARFSACFLESFDVMFTGHGLTPFCQRRLEYASELNSICEGLDQLDVNTSGVVVMYTPTDSHSA